MHSRFAELARLNEPWPFIEQVAGCGRSFHQNSINSLKTKLERYQYDELEVYCLYSEEHVPPLQVGDCSSNIFLILPFVYFITRLL
jgi:hypothetical protein